MGQPVKRSNQLVLDARVTGQVAERSIASQIEFWARLGRAVEPLLSGDRALALRQSSDAKPLSELIGSIDSESGRERVAEYLGRQPFPHYEPAGDEDGTLVRIDENGRRTPGRFVKGEFVLAAKKRKST